MRFCRWTESATAAWFTTRTKREITLFYECDQEHAAAFMREKLSASLPRYMLPTVFNRMDQMPRNPNGKIDRAKLVASVN